MENKKNEDKRIERRIPLHFLIGLNVALLLTLAAFEWTSEVKPVDIDYKSAEGIVIEEPPLFKEKVVPPKPKPTSPEFKEVEKEEIEKEELEKEEILTSDPLQLGNIDSLISSLTTIVDNSGDEAPFTYVEEMPSFPGGWSEFNKFIAKNVKYPRHAINIGMEGTVYVEFVIEKDGSITDLKVVKGVGAGLDEESIRVMNLVPNFLPGKQRGVPVRVKKVLPIKFRLK
ncbi:MAG: energy transducer TonB [Cyclobacteriaceae bacterium]